MSEQLKNTHFSDVVTVARVSLEHFIVETKSIFYLVLMSFLI